jgi:dipeptidyl aminopeptidase/acylaminoacyl peptidase
MSTPNTAPAHPFDQPDHFVAIPRIGDVLVSADGQRVVAAVSQLDDDGAKFVTSLWALDPTGAGPARQLTRSSEGESSAAFTPDGSLLFTSSRPRPKGSTDDNAEQAAVWFLPAGGGDASVVANPPGGVRAVVTAARARTVVISVPSAPGGVGDAENDTWWKDRRKRKISAVLHESTPVRHWDHHVGSEEIHLFVGQLPEFPGVSPIGFRDLTPDAGHALYEAHPVLSPDGCTVFVDWMVPLERGRVRVDVVAIDVETGARQTVASSADGSFNFEQPAISPDGRRLVTLRTSRPTIEDPWVVDLWLVDLPGGESRALNPGDLPFIQGVTFDADGSSLILTTDCQGHGPLFQIALSSGEVTRLTQDGAWTSVRSHPDGSLLALRSRVAEPPRPVRLEPGTATTTLLDAPGVVARIPGRVEEVEATAADGTALRAWLALPEGASPSSPAPLVLFVHGGPVGSWNSWHWRWNPWVLAARGWAVLMPDPALSTGYGAAMIQRGWGQWGGAPYDDLMALTDAALDRPDLDASRTAAMGGSYGGYMANWIAGHTTRFSAIVSHASVWSLEQFQGTTDWPEIWADEWGYPDTNPKLYETWSPDRFADEIRTPMLLIHGERDYRCPVGESLRLWSDLTRRAQNARFLWFANENHWILQPGDAVVWYETVLAFLDEHVLGRPWQRPALL